MKILIVTSILVLIACNPRVEKHLIFGTKEKDTIIIAPHQAIDSAWCKSDSLIQVITSLNDSIVLLKKQIFINRFKVERVRYYLNICKRRPSQTQFLVSWISRAIN